MPIFNHFGISNLNFSTENKKRVHFFTLITALFLWTPLTQLRMLTRQTYGKFDLPVFRLATPQRYGQPGHVELVRQPPQGTVTEPLQEFGASATPLYWLVNTQGNFASSVEFLQKAYRRMEALKSSRVTSKYNYFLTTCTKTIKYM